MLVETSARITAEEFFQLPQTSTPCFLLNGEVIALTAPELDHQNMVGNFFVMLKLLETVIGGKAYVAPVDVYLDEYNVSQPDVLWVALDSRCKPDGKKRLVGAPDLVIEVLSPSTARIDKTTKFLLYEKHSVREYWMADPARKTVEVWVLREQEFVPQGTYGADEHFISAVLGGHTVELALMLA